MSKFTNRFNEDPFGLETFRPQDWFPGTATPTPQGTDIPVAHAPQESGGIAPVAPLNDHALLNYAHNSHVAAQVGALQQAPATSAAAQPSLLGSSKPPREVAKPASTTMSPVAVTVSPPPPPTQTPWELPVAEAPANPADLIASEMKLAMLRGMFPQHSITPVEYDPWKALPQGLGTKVDVNAGGGT